ncbi:hypothetical protein PENSPDRAFT_35150 [Peniophora sp. CONT]|nr:hypothetical protein PENSPDRAFT_35150 [Peniophora sp. CONT]
MSTTFIGKPISLISHSDVRYRGILAGIDPNASTIQLSNVYSMGTENRRPAAQFIPPVPDPYEYIIFRASEVKDLSVDEPQPRPTLASDPAIINAVSAQVPQQQQYGQFNGAPGYATNGAPQQRAQQPPAAAQAAQQPSSYAQRAGAGGNSVSTADASLETVGRALADSKAASRNGGSRAAPPVAVPAQDFDFQGSNAKFNKEAVSPGPEQDDDVEPAYNPQRSFFDSLSSGAGGGGSSGAPVRGGGRGGRGRGGRNRREEERERNVATFGEPGGVGLMGPGAYVGGWGGYGRRGGGGRGRRGGGVTQR